MKIKKKEMMQRASQKTCSSSVKKKNPRSPIRKHCYLDETGNTGLNHFDENQKVFLLGGVLASENLDESLKSDFQKIYERLQADELHAAVVGKSGIAKVSDLLIKLIQKHDLQFFFSAVEKEYFLSIMIFHVFYDNGLNPAVNPLAQANRLMRMTLSYNFCSLVEKDHLRDFWNAAKNSDEELFAKVLRGIQDNLKKVNLDRRSDELIYDALEYAIQNPSELIRSMKFDEMCSPNISAFSLMINMLNQVHLGTSTVIEEVVHDEQKQFGKFLKSSFKLFSRYTQSSAPMTSLVDMQEADIIKQAELKLCESNASLGLQIIDVALWVMKRVLFGQTISGLEKLSQVITDRSFLDGISFRQHGQWLVDNLDSFQNMEFTPEQMQAGQTLHKEVESKRWRPTKK